MKKSKVIKKDGAWRILRHDGEIVGAYSTKELAETALNKPWFE